MKRDEFRGYSTKIHKSQFMSHKRPGGRELDLVKGSRKKGRAEETPLKFTEHKDSEGKRKA